jgi:hypothetical protein
MDGVKNDDNKDNKIFEEKEIINEEEQNTKLIVESIAGIETTDLYFDEEKGEFYQPIDNLIFKGKNKETFNDFNGIKYFRFDNLEIWVYNEGRDWQFSRNDFCSEFCVYYIPERNSYELKINSEFKFIVVEKNNKIFEEKRNFRIKVKSIDEIETTDLYYNRMEDVFYQPFDNLIEWNEDNSFTININNEERKFISEYLEFISIDENNCYFKNLEDEIKKREAEEREAEEREAEEREANLIEIPDEDWIEIPDEEFFADNHFLRNVDNEDENGNHGINLSIPDLEAPEVKNNYPSFICSIREC